MYTLCDAQRMQDNHTFQIYKTGLISPWGCLGHTKPLHFLIAPGLMPSTKYMII